jgi:hypothetical protein
MSLKEVLKKTCPQCGKLFETTNQRKKYCDLFCNQDAKIQKRKKHKSGEISNIQEQILQIMQTKIDQALSANDVSAAGVQIALSGIGNAMKGLVRRGLAKITTRGDGRGQKTHYRLTKAGIQVELSV